MIRNYLKVAWRNLLKNRLYSFINIAGLATGMAVALLIGLWIHDEVSFDKKNTDNYDRIGQVWQFVNFGSGIASYNITPIPLGKDMRDHYPDFQYISLSSQLHNQVLTFGDKLLSRQGDYVEPDFTEMLTLPMLKGSRAALKDRNAVLLSSSTATALFGNDNPMGKTIKVDNKNNLVVQGVYADFPHNSSFFNYDFLGNWDFYAADNKYNMTEWDNNSWQIFAQLKPGASFAGASEKIRDARARQGNMPSYKPQFFLHPMSRWHLYADFKDGKNTGGVITFVWLFGIIGAFVLLLACINFMNLSTARSEKRAREVGIRKAIGSVRGQLIAQFFSESILIVLLAFAVSILLASISLPFFNHLADKNMVILWSNPWFWILGLSFSLFTAIVAGSYPALYLSSFQPVKVLKGDLTRSRTRPSQWLGRSFIKAGPKASIPRKVLVTLQFTVSVLLIIGTIVVFRQIQFAKDLPAGYSRSGLIQMDINTEDLRKHSESIRTELLASGAVTAYAQTSCPITDNWGGTVAISWTGKDPNAHPLLNANFVTTDFGKAVEWQILEGRDFSADQKTDSSAIILNEASLAIMGFKHPLGEIIKYGDRPYTVIGVTKNMIRDDPFHKIAPSFYCMDPKNTGTLEIKLNTAIPTSEALHKAELVFKKYNPASPFTYRFVDEEYAKKFGNEERIGGLASFFTSLAIFISCLGLFGLASFVAEQRTREIGIRKVLGASLPHVWSLLSTEFMLLVGLSFLIAMPLAYYLMHNWLQNYENHTGMPWWIFALAGSGALLITLLTVSIQAIKAGLANPIKSLRSE